MNNHNQRPSPSLAMDAVERIFKAFDLSYIRTQKRTETIYSAIRWSQKERAEVVIFPTSRRCSLLFCSSFAFIPPPGSMVRLRRFFQDEALDLRGQSLEFYPHQGAQITIRSWLPEAELSPDQLQAVLEPSLRQLMASSILLFPKLAQLLNKLERLIPSDDFHLPS